jgi:hypothetical protein
MFGEDDDDEQDDIQNAEDSNTKDTTTENADNDMQSFLSMVGSLKE